MSFWAFVGILVILGIMFGALYLSKLADRQQQIEQQKRKQIRTMRNDLVDIDELINTLLIYDRDTDLLVILAKRMKKSIEDGLILLPNNEDLLADMSDLERTFTSIQSFIDAPQEPEVPNSDRQIFLIKKHFARAVRLIREMQITGDITELEAGQHRTRLMKNALLLEVKAYRKHGENAKERGEISSAANYLKHAKELLVGSDLKFAEKTDHIKSVSRAISALYVTMPNHDENEDKKKSD